jgi:hypothetical protein
MILNVKDLQQLKTNVGVDKSFLLNKVRELNARMSYSTLYKCYNICTFGQINSKLTIEQNLFFKIKKGLLMCSAVLTKTKTKTKLKMFLIKKTFYSFEP